MHRTLSRMSAWLKPSGKSHKPRKSKINRRKNSAPIPSKRVENSFASAATGINGYSKAFEFAQVNSDAAFDFAKQLMSATSLSDMVILWSTYVRKQFEIVSEQTKELGMFGPMVATEMAPAQTAMLENSPTNPHSYNSTSARSSTWS